MASQSLGIRLAASCRSDDFQVKVRFDAHDWFTQAGDDEIAALHRSGYRGEAADELALYASGQAALSPSAKGSPVDAVFRYLTTYKPRTHDGGIVGFEVSLKSADVARWLDRYRPDLRAGLFPEYVPPALESLAC